MVNKLALLVWLVWLEWTVVTLSAQVHISTVSHSTVCYSNQFEVTCSYPEVMSPGKYLVPLPGWKVNGSQVIPDGIVYREEIASISMTKLIVTVTGTSFVNTVTTFSCFLVLADAQLDESTQQVHITTMATPIPPKITVVTSSNSCISLTWTHDRTCFETVPVKYHVQLNTSNQPIITDQMTAEITGVTSGTSYTVSVMAVADDTQRSEVNSESITAGFPSISTEQASQCFERPFVITCHHQYKTTDAPLWLKDGAQVEDGIDEIAIEDRTVTLLNVSQNIFAERETSFQCCVEMPSGALVSGELYIFDPLEQPSAPALTISNIEQTSISLSWEVSMACFEEVNFTISIFWTSVSGNGQATDVLGNNYTITDLIPGVMYNITLVAIGGGVMSSSTSISISTSTLSSYTGMLTAGLISMITAVAVFAAVAVIAILALISNFAYRQSQRKRRSKEPPIYHQRCMVARELNMAVEPLY